LVGTLLSNLGGPADATAAGSAIAEVTEAQLVDAIDAMARGDIEFVILEDGEAFLQAAGDGDGPYQLEFRAGAEAEQLEVPGGVDRATVQARLTAFRRRDARWRDSLDWSPLPG
jgi:hypothetical protein